MRGSTLIDITGNTVGETEFQEIHPGQVAEETLVVGVPAYTYRPQGSATELGVETVDVGIVFSKRTENVIFVIIGVGCVEITRTIAMANFFHDSHSVFKIGCERELVARERRAVHLKVRRIAHLR